MKASLHLVQESILFLSKGRNHSLAFARNENGKTFNLTTSSSTIIFAHHIDQQNS